MKKLESSLKNMMLSLFFICAVMSAALSLVYMSTKGPIEATEQKKINDAIGLVVPAFDNNPSSDMYKVGIIDSVGGTIISDTLNFYPAFSGGKIVGTAVKTYTNKGFGGFISIMIGFSPDGKIINTKVMEQKETPGLGTKMNDVKFHDQFNGKSSSDFKFSVKKDGGDVDAITAATISSRAFCDAVNRAYKAFNNSASVNSVSDTLTTKNKSENGGEE